MPTPLQVVVFGVLTAAAVAASRNSWRAHETYGLFRFLGFETLALLIARNAHRWFARPFSSPQLLSWTILLVSLALAVHGARLLARVGKARSRLIEDTEAIVEVGVYRFIRHPLYASLILLAWGAFLKGLDVVSGVLALAATALFAATAGYEERFNLARFGAAYSEYRRRTKMFIPYIL